MPNFYTEAEIIKSDFLLVSYKHENKEIVSETVEWLISSGVRLWYDKDLKAGDEWDERVERLIKHPNCTGAIFFNSRQSFLSSAVAKERALVLEKRKEFSSLKKKFLVLPVNIGKPSTLQLLKQVFDTLPDNESELSLRFPPETIKVILDLFKTNIVYCKVDDPNFKQSIYDTINEDMSGVIDKSKLEFEKISNLYSTKTNQGYSCIELGHWKNALINPNFFPNYISSKCNDGKFQYNGNLYIASSGKFYDLKPISWIYLYEEDGIVTLLSESFLDVGHGGKELTEWLENTFRSSAFDEAEQTALGIKICLLTKEDIEKSQVKIPVCKENELGEKNWWIDEFNGNLQKVIRENGEIYENGYRINTIRAIRPVIRIPAENLIKFLDKK